MFFYLYLIANFLKNMLVSKALAFLTLLVTFDKSETLNVNQNRYIFKTTRRSKFWNCLQENIRPQVVATVGCSLLEARRLQKLLRRRRSVRVRPE